MPFLYYHKNQQLTKSHVANEKGLKILCFTKKMVDPHCLFSMVLNCDTWHNTNMPHGIFEFWSK
jgi:hypothetical protein